MQTTPYDVNTTRYERCINASKRIRWDIDTDVIRDRDFDYDQKFLPDGLSLVTELAFLTVGEQRLLSQIQGRTYTNLFGLVERYINAKILELSRDHWFGDQVALEALIRFSDEELKHQELFRRLEGMIAKGMPDGYSFLPDPNDVAHAVLDKSTWAVLGLTCHIELFTLAHYKQSIEPNDNLSPLFKDVFLFHWKEESQHAILDELEWRREDAKLTHDERDRAVNDLIDLVGAVDGILQMQSAADAEYFTRICGRTLRNADIDRLTTGVLRAYRWQYIVSGVKDGRFVSVLTDLIDDTQARRITDALEPLM